MITGGCLCGAVRFEVEAFVGPFELCHCNRCRKVSGTAFMAGIGVRRSQFRWLSGEDLVRSYEAPLLEEPPAYRVTFCRVCGSPVPDPEADGDWFELAAGLLDGDPKRRPDRHIYVEHKAPWHEIADELPQLDKLSLRRLRQVPDS